jgi:hypothetical protein
VVNGIGHLPLVFNDLLADKVTGLDDCDIFTHQLPTQNLLPNLLLTLIEPMHVNDTHISQRDDQTKPAALGGPLSFKAKDRLALLLVLVDEQDAFIDKMRKLWTQY